MGGPPALPLAEAAAPSIAEGVKAVFDEVFGSIVFKKLLQDGADLISPNLLSNISEWNVCTRLALLIRLAQVQKDVEDAAGPQIQQIAAAALSGLFGVPIAPGDVPLNQAGGPEIPAGTKLGDLLLRSAFGAYETQDHLSPRDGLDNMRKVLGMVLSVAIDGWVGGMVDLGAISKDLPEFGKLKETIEAHMGFGRIVPRAMRPLIDLLVIEPATQQIRSQLGNTLFTPEQIVRLFLREEVEATEMFDMMALHGYSRGPASELLVLHSELPGLADIRGLLELGLVTEAGALDYLKARGMLPEVATGMLEVIKNDRVRALRNELVSVARAMFSSREVDEPQLRAACAAAQYTESETTAVVAVGLMQRGRRTFLTSAEALEAYIENAWSVEELTAFYARAGYNPDDVETLLTLAQKKKATAQGKAAALAKKLPEPGPADVTLSAAMELRRRSIIRTDQLVAYLKALGLQGARLDAEVAIAEAQARDYLAAVARQLKTKSSSALSAGPIEQLYVRGLVDEDALRQFYVEAGFLPVMIDLLVQLRTAERDDYAAKQAAAAAKAKRLPVPDSTQETQATAQELRRRGIIDHDQLAAALKGLGLSGARLTSEVALADDNAAVFAAALAKKEAPPPPVPAVKAHPAEIEKLYERGLIDDDSLRAFYVSSGFKQDQIPLLMQLRQAERADYLAKHPAPAPTPPPPAGP